MPIRMQSKERLRNHKAQNRVAKKLQPLVVAGAIRGFVAIRAEATGLTRRGTPILKLVFQGRLLVASDRCVKARTSSSGTLNGCPSALSRSARTASTCASRFTGSCRNQGS